MRDNVRLPRGILGRFHWGVSLPERPVPCNHAGSLVRRLVCVGLPGHSLGDDRPAGHSLVRPSSVASTAEGGTAGLWPIIMFHFCHLLLDKSEFEGLLNN